MNFAFRGLSRRPLSEPEALRRWIARHEGYAAMQPRVYATIEEARERIQRVDSRLDDAFAIELARHALRPVEGGYIWKFDPVGRGRTSDEIDLEAVRRFWSRWGARCCTCSEAPRRGRRPRRWRRTGQPSATRAG